MITFIISLVLLVVGYLCYGRFVGRVFGVDPSRPTPCQTMADGVDFLPLPTWKVFLIQFLNIAGTGPIFGAIQGILFGPAAYLWIVLGCIFGGAVHDYLSGMISLRKGGVSLPEMVGDELGKGMRGVMIFIAMLLMILVGAVFVLTPAGLLANLSTGWGVWGSTTVWMIVIFVYYILATLLPIDKLIGRVYPLFGLALLIMAVGLLIGLFVYPQHLPEITQAFSNHHPHSSMPLFPGLCITIACGAVSGFHATQSPMMARCLKNERLAHGVFYGAMITEGVVALIWAAAAINIGTSLQGDNSPYEGLWQAMLSPEGKPNPAILVNYICHTWMGKVGAVLAILGVVAAPITSGDTALRSARLIAADALKIKQNKLYKRLLVAVPVFAISGALMFINFDVLWRYFGFINQTLAAVTLWTITVYLARRHKLYWIALVPAVWMTMVCTSYILIAPEGFQLLPWLSYAVALVVVVVCLGLFFVWRNKQHR